MAGDLSCCREVNMLVLHQSSWGYTSKYEGKNTSPQPLMTALCNYHFLFYQIHPQKRNDLIKSAEKADTFKWRKKDPEDLAEGNRQSMLVDPGEG